MRGKTVLMNFTGAYGNEAVSRLPRDGCQDSRLLRGTDGLCDTGSVSLCAASWPSPAGKGAYHRLRRPLGEQVCVAGAAGCLVNAGPAGLRGGAA